MHEILWARTYKFDSSVKIALVVSWVEQQYESLDAHDRDKEDGGPRNHVKHHPRDRTQVFICRVFLAFRGELPALGSRQGQQDSITDSYPLTGTSTTCLLGVSSSGIIIHCSCIQICVFPDLNTARWYLTIYQLELMVLFLRVL